MGERLTTTEQALLETAANSAAEDVEEYTTKRGTPTWTEHRVGRMLARDPVFARLVPIALDELRAARQQALTEEDREALGIGRQLIVEVLHDRRPDSHASDSQRAAWNSVAGALAVLDKLLKGGA